MYIKLSGEFDSVEFAEFAAKNIRERIDGQKKIVIFQNKNKFRGSATSAVEFAASADNEMLIFPFSTHSNNNFISGMVSRRADEYPENELLLTKSVRMEVMCEKQNKEKAIQYMLSCGGYDIKG